MTLADPPPRRVTILGVHVADLSRAAALAALAEVLATERRDCRRLYFVNAHTLNVAAEEPRFRPVLNAAEFLFNDGTGVRWASRRRGVELRDNLNGTDLVPDLFRATSGRGHRCFLLGASAATIEPAARVARDRFTGWTFVGHHHGFVSSDEEPALVERINATRADLLLVGMGNPLQEFWIDRNRSRLTVSLAAGVGGLFDFWIDRPRRAPLWVRRAGCEWLHKLLLQPWKWRRYLLGNPKFVVRASRALRADLTAMERDSGEARGLTNNS